MQTTRTTIVFAAALTLVAVACVHAPPDPPSPTTTSSTTSPTSTTQVAPSTTTVTSTSPPPTSTTTMPPPPTTSTAVPGEVPGLTDPAALSDYAGPSTITGGTVVIENKRIGGRLTVEGGHVTIRNTLFRFEDYYQLVNAGGVVVVEHSQFDGMNGRSNMMGATGSDLTVRWSTFTGFENAMRLETNSRAEHNLIAQPTTSRLDAHTDGIEVGEGSNIVIRSNTINIDGGVGATGCINIGTPFASVDNVVVEDNDLTGGTYSLYVRRDDNGTSLTNVRVVNNRWHTPHVYGTHSVDPTGAVTAWRDNTLDGVPISL